METPLDHAHRAMQSAPEDDRARLAFFGRLADDELFVMLAAEPGGEAIEPELFEVEGERYVLAFDREDRLAGFAGRPVPYVALPGRVLAAQLAAGGTGLGLNLGAPSETLLPPASLGWLVETLAQEVAGKAEARPQSFEAPSDLPEPLLARLSEKLAKAPGIASEAWLAGVTYAGGGRGHLLAFTGAAPEAEAALARAVAEALVFSGTEAGALDVTFLSPDDPALPGLRQVGRALDIPPPSHPPRSAPPTAPGSDPDRPPRLR